MSDPISVPKRSVAGQGGIWWQPVRSTRVGLTAFIRDPNCHIVFLTRHVIKEDGTIEPEAKCGKCDFTVARLLEWVPDTPIERATAS